MKLIQGDKSQLRPIGLNHGHNQYLWCQEGGNTSFPMLLHKGSLTDQIFHHIKLSNNGLHYHQY